MTRLLVDDRWKVGGIGRYAQELTSRLSDDFDVKFLSTDISITDPLSPIRLSAAIRRVQPDVFWTPGFMPPIASPVPFVFTMHDLIHVHAAGGLRRLYYDWVIRPIAQKASRIVTVSEFSRAEICEWAGLPESGVAVIPNGVSSEYSPRGDSFDPGYPYLLYVGARKAHKNLEVMLRAFARAGLSGSCRFLLSGEPSEPLQVLATELGIAGDVSFAGFVTEQKLPALYRGAKAVVMVSTYEGFGLPVLEGMASGVPVLCSNTTSLAEVGGDATLLVDPSDVDAIAEAMQRIVCDEGLRESLKLRGPERARSYSWDASAAKLSQVLRDAASGFAAR